MLIVNSSHEPAWTIGSLNGSSFPWSNSCNFLPSSVSKLHSIVSNYPRIVSNLTQSQAHHRGPTYESRPCPPYALKPHDPRPLCSLDGEMDVNPPMQLVHLAPYPWKLVPEVYLLAEFTFSDLRRAEGVEG